MQAKMPAPRGAGNASPCERSEKVCMVAPDECLERLQLVAGVVFQVPLLRRVERQFEADEEMLGVRLEVSTVAASRFWSRQRRLSLRASLARKTSFFLNPGRGVSV